MREHSDHMRQWHAEDEGAHKVAVRSPRSRCDYCFGSTIREAMAMGVMPAIRLPGPRSHYPIYPPSLENPIERLAATMFPEDDYGEDVREHAVLALSQVATIELPAVALEVPVESGSGTLQMLGPHLPVYGRISIRRPRLLVDISALIGVAIACATAPGAIISAVVLALAPSIFTSARMNNRQQNAFALLAVMTRDWISSAARPVPVFSSVELIAAETSISSCLPMSGSQTAPDPIKARIDTDGLRRIIATMHQLAGMGMVDCVDGTGKPTVQLPCETLCSLTPIEQHARRAESSCISHNQSGRLVWNHEPWDSESGVWSIVDRQLSFE